MTYESIFNKTSLRRAGGGITRAIPTRHRVNVFAIDALLFLYTNRSLKKKKNVMSRSTFALNIFRGFRLEKL